jgi:hypothetical protein
VSSSQWSASPSLHESAVNRGWTAASPQRTDTGWSTSKSSSSRNRDRDRDYDDRSREDGTLGIYLSNPESKSLPRKSVRVDCQWGLQSVCEVSGLFGRDGQEFLWVGRTQTRGKKQKRKYCEPALQST